MKYLNTIFLAIALLVMACKKDKDTNLAQKPDDKPDTEAGVSKHPYKEMLGNWKMYKEVTDLPRDLMLYGETILEINEDSTYMYIFRNNDHPESNVTLNASYKIDGGLYTNGFMPVKMSKGVYSLMLKAQNDTLIIFNGVGSTFYTRIK